MARLYGSLDRLVSAEAIDVGTTTLSEGLDEAHGVERRFGVGFQLQTASRPLGPEPDAFGHGGAGGSSHGAWPAKQVGFSYAMNLMRDDQDVDARPQALLRALHDAL